MAKLALVGPTYQLEGRSFDHQRCVNLEALLSESETSKEPAALIGTPGLTLFCDLNNGPSRGQHTTSKKGRAFSVSGNKLFEIFADGTFEQRGELLTATSSRVSMADNGQQLIVVDKYFGYILNLENLTFEQITDDAFPGGDIVVFLDGYFIVNRPGTGQFYISGLYDGLAWNGTDFATVESSTDDLLGMVVLEGLLYLFGTDSYEVYYNSGAADFPFTRVPNARKEYGTVSSFAPQKIGNAIIFLAQDDEGQGAVMLIQRGSDPQTISTRAIEEKINETSDITGAYAFTYYRNKHRYYCLQLPGLNTTLVFNLFTGMWHERMYFNASLGKERQWLATSHAKFKGFNLVADRRNGKIYKLDPKAFSDDGDEIHRIRITPVIHNEMNRMFFKELHIDMEPGVGLTAGQGSEPLLQMRYSDDGGFTWSDVRTSGVGSIGEYKTRARYTRLGSARDRIFEFRYTEPTFTQFNGAYLDAQAGAH
jgi:hypothetical protein